jgi:hypothetical protein
MNQGIERIQSDRLKMTGVARNHCRPPRIDPSLAFCYYWYMKLMWHGEEIDLPDIGHEDARKLQELIALNKQDEVEALLTKLRVIDSKDAA